LNVNSIGVISSIAFYLGGFSFLITINKVGRRGEEGGLKLTSSIHLLQKFNIHPPPFITLGGKS